MPQGGSAKVCHVHGQHRSRSLCIVLRMRDANGWLQPAKLPPLSANYGYVRVSVLSPATVMTLPTGRFFTANFVVA